MWFAGFKKSGLFSYFSHPIAAVASFVWVFFGAVSAVLFPYGAKADESPIFPLVRTSVASNAAMTIQPISLPLQDSREQVQRISATEHHDLKGWDFLFSEMVKQGVDPDRLAQIFSDNRMPARELLQFGIAPKEPKSLYRRQNSAQSRKHALQFYRSHYRYFKGAGLEYQIPESVVLAILQIESHCGGYTGNSRVFYKLARLGAAAAPENLSSLIQLRSITETSETFRLLKERAAWLENEFLPHTVAAIALADQLNIHPLEVRGSAAGAVGFPQFLPGNIKRFGGDGDNDGVINVYEAPDAIYSIAHFLQRSGWHETPALSRKDKRDVVWKYNHSIAYVDTVFALADALEPGIRAIKPDLEDYLQNPTLPRTPTLLEVR